MKSVTPTTTRDILGLAVLAVLIESPSRRAGVVDAVRRLCLPWLTPTREVVTVLLSEYCEAEFVHATNQRLPNVHSSSDLLLAITAAGERELRRLALRRTEHPSHHLAMLCESLRLSIINRLDPVAQREIVRGHIDARRRCLAMQQRRLMEAGTENPTLARTLRHQIACAQAEFDALACTSRMRPERTPAPEHTHSRTIAPAQAEFDALVGEPREDEGDALPFLPFST